MAVFDPAGAKAAIRVKAGELEFEAFGVCDLDMSWEAGGRLEQFIAEGRHGEMGWMETTLPRRLHPRSLWPEARSAILLGLNYGPDENPLAALTRKTLGAVSVYAQGQDYHEVIKARLKTLGRWMAQTYGCELKVFVDTAPLMEKPLAQLSGMGWQGKHTNLVSRTFGSWLFLGVVLTTLDLPADAPEGDHCGSCRACLDICPTQAFPAPYQLDARRCISYLTIEHAGPVPLEFRERLGNRIYGCDDCLAVCPWNKFAAVAQEAAFHARETLRAPALADLATLDDTGFRSLFSKSPIKRIGRDRFVRNVMYALGNSGRADLAPVARARLDDASPVVRDAALWSLSRLETTDDGQTAAIRPSP